MKVTATINGIDYIVDFYKGKDRDNRQVLARLVEDQAKEWRDSTIFVGNFPERGRYLIKSAGFISLQAGG